MKKDSMRLIYAVGDIHGRFDLLLKAEEAILEHLGNNEGLVIFLGDYVDRGPDSSKVVEYLMSKTNPICLKGNHEDLMVSALEGGNYRLWIANGGDATLESYGWDIPKRHIEWMKNLPLIVTDGHRIYVHAGIDPDKLLDEQDDATLMWIRDKFLRATELPTHVVHGHTHTWAGKKTAEPELLPHRTNLDTCAFYTGILSVGVFNADEPGGPIEVLQIQL